MIAVVDLGQDSATLTQALRSLGADVLVTSDPEFLREANGLILDTGAPMDTTMEKLKAMRADRMIERRIAGGRPVLGIGTGMHAMFERSTEPAAEGLAQIPGIVETLPAPRTQWARVKAPCESVLFEGIEDQQFHFEHAHAVHSDPAAELTEELFDPPLVAFCECESPIVAALEYGPLMATQFHPERSADAGLELLRNWLATC